MSISSTIITSTVAMNVHGVSATASLGEQFNKYQTNINSNDSDSCENTQPTVESTPSFDHESDKNSEDGYSASGSESLTGSSSAETDQEGHTTPEYVPGCFEGPEKTMEVVFKAGVGAEQGLRALTREQLDHLCTQAKCTILSKISSSYIDAYVLSESSLFIYKHKYIMKTCGTTTLLRCLSSLLQFADALGMQLTWVGYSRKNLLFPSAQLWPHSNFGDEIKYITSHDKLQDRLRGNGHILGPITGDHWFVYVADHSEIDMPIPMTRCQSMPAFGSNGLLPLTASAAASVPTPSADRTVNLMMFDMAPEVAKIFFKSSCETGKEMTAKAGIDHLCPGATIDETAFTPCGYSMNAILYDAYFTIHITPEKECSYASFETNTSLPSYASMVRNVLNVFRPKRFVLTMFADESAIDSMVELPTDPKKINVPGFGMYARTSLASTKVETDLCCLMGCYTLSLDHPKEIQNGSKAKAMAMLTSSIESTTSSLGSGMVERATGARSHVRTNSATVFTAQWFD